MKKTFERFSTGVASDRWRLYYRDFAAIRIKKPPLIYQENVVKELIVIEEAIRATEDALLKTVEIQKVLLKELLIGAAHV